MMGLWNNSELTVKNTKSQKRATKELQVQNWVSFFLWGWFLWSFGEGWWWKWRSKVPPPRSLWPSAYLQGLSSRSLAVVTVAQRPWEKQYNGNVRKELLIQSVISCLVVLTIDMYISILSDLLPKCVFGDLLQNVWM